MVYTVSLLTDFPNIFCEYVMSMYVMKEMCIVYLCLCCVCQFVEDVEDDEYPRPRSQRAGKRKSAKKPITQVSTGGSPTFI